MASNSQAHLPKRTIIFESYAWHDAQEIAKRLRRDLEARGFDVWLDVERMRNPDRWSMEIVEAIDRADVVLALLSPQAVRTVASPDSIDGQDSVVHYELQRARYSRKPIVPVLVLACAAPPLLGALPLDWSDWHRSEESYRQGVERIVDTLIQTSHGAGSLYSRFVDLLEPIDFYLPLARHRQRFCGREWIFDAVEQWLKSNSRCLLIEGEPGIGKSALAAELIFRNPGEQVVAHFVIDRSIGATRQPKTFVRTIAALLAGALPTYRAAVEQGDVSRWLMRDLCATDPLGAFVQGVLRPLCNAPTPEGGTRYIVIDGLDEALGQLAPRESEGHAISIPGLLAAALKDFPDWLRIVATTRPDSRVAPLFGVAQRLILYPKDERQRRDLDTYVNRRLVEESFVGKLASANCDAAAAAALINARSDGSFLYAQLTLDGLNDGTITFDALSTLPPGLASLYHDLFLRLFPTPADYTPAASVLEVLIASRDGLTESELAAATSLNLSKELRPALASLWSYLANVDHTYRPDIEPRYRVYHKSLVDWLATPPAGHREFRLDRGRGERTLLAYCGSWRTLKHQYQLVNLVIHLVAANELEEAAKILAGEFPELRAQVLETRGYDLDDMAVLAEALLAAKRDDDIVRHATTTNAWFRDGVSAALRSFGDIPRIDAIVRQLLRQRARKPKELSPEIVNGRLVGIRAASAHGLDRRLVEAAADPASAVRIVLVPELYRYWRRSGEAGWELVERLADRTVSRFGIPSGESLETLGHLSLAILHEHRRRPQEMDRLQAILRGMVHRLTSSKLFRLLGSRAVLRVLTHPLGQLLNRQPDYQPLNLKELAITFATPSEARRAWVRVVECWEQDDDQIDAIKNALFDKSRPFDLFLMLASERALIVKGVKNFLVVFDAVEQIYRDGCPWYRQSVLYVLFHLLSRVPQISAEHLDRYAALTRDFVETEKASLKSSTKTYGFAPHMAWAEIVFSRHHQRRGPHFLPDFLKLAQSSGDRDLIARVFKAIDLLSFAYEEHELALDAVDAALKLKDKSLEPFILTSLANIRLQDQPSVEGFLADRQLDDLKRRSAVIAPTIRAEDIPTWIDDFFVHWMVSSKWFRDEVCGAFRRAADARSNAEFLHQTLVWVIDLIAGRSKANP